MNATDIQLIINGALALPGVSLTQTDIDSDGDVDASDVQFMINGALGLPVNP